MAGETPTRRLTTIVAGDVAGYSRLVSEDEDGTFAALRTHRHELIDPKIAEYRGRVANTAGDSILIEFPSVIEALRCMIEIQQGMVERNAEAPDERRIWFRVGINLGDVIEQEDGDLLGDGVNVAARLEGLAVPGGICISRGVRDNVRDRLDVVLEDMGEVEVKNIARPVRVFRVLPEGEAPAAARRQPVRKMFAAAAVAILLVLVVGGLWWWKPWLDRIEPANPAKMAFALPDNPSLVVLPFENLTGEPDRQFLIDGFLDQLITMLSLNPDVLVISRVSSFTFRGQNLPVRQVAEELGVRYVIEGSLQQAGERIRINVQLIDAIKGFHVWSKAFDRSAGDLFAVQDDVIGAISVELLGRRGEIMAAEHRRLRPQQPKDLSVFELGEKSSEAYFKRTKDDNLRARGMVLEMLERDPENARAHAFMAASTFAEVWFGWTEDRKAAVKHGCEWAEKAVALDPREYMSQWMLSFCYRLTNRPAEMRRALEATVRLNPSDPIVAASYVTGVLLPEGRADEAVARLKRIERANPRDTAVNDNIFDGFVRAYFHQENYGQVVTYAARISEAFGKIIDIRLMNLAALYHLGDLDKARTELGTFLSDHPEFSLSEFAERNQIVSQGSKAAVAEALRALGVPE